MDGDCNKSEAKNKQFCNSRQTNNTSQSVTNQPSNHHSVRGAFGGADGSLPSCSSHSDSSSHDVEFPPVGDQGAMNRSLHAVNDHRHSMSGITTANGAVPSNSSLSAVVKASSTGTLSTTPSRYLPPTSRHESTFSSSSNAFLLSFPTLSCSGSALGNSLAMSSSANAGKSANANSTLEPVPSNSPNNQILPLNASSTVGPPPPQNYDQATYNWQDSKMCVKDRLTYLFNTDTMTDIQFQVV